MVKHTVVKAVLCGVTCDNLEGHDTISEQKISFRQFQRSQWPFFVNVPGGTRKTFEIIAMYNLLE